MSVLTRVEAVLEELIAQQERRRLDAARRVMPCATGDDADQPHDHPGLASDPHFHYEDGILAGLMAARAAIRARVPRDEADPTTGPRVGPERGANDT